MRIKPFLLFLLIVITTYQCYKLINVTFPHYEVKYYHDKRVLCWIMTAPKNVGRALAVKATWGKHCDKLIFISTEHNSELPTVVVNVSEGYNNLWGKTQRAFEYVYSHHYNDADWFLKADDDTFIIVENLKFLLKDVDPHKPIWFGCKFRPYVKQGYMSGGAGYVLSKSALELFAKRNSSICRSAEQGVEDVEMGKCLEKLNVIAGDSRDTTGKGRFFPLIPEHHILPVPLEWYWKYLFYPSEHGKDCCSNRTVSFHYIPPRMMHTLNYIVYNLTTW